MIDRIRIQNFKSLRNLDVKLGLTNVLIGPNMSGKSNFIDAFRFLRDLLVPSGSAQGLANAMMKRNGFQEVAWKGEGDVEDVIGFALDGTLPGMPEKTVAWSYRLEILGERRYGNVSVQREGLTISGPDGPFELIATNQGQRVVNSRERSPIFQVPDPTKLALEYEFPGWEGNDVRISVASWRFYRLIPQLMRQANPSSAAQVLSEFGENLVLLPFRVLSSQPCPKPAFIWARKCVPRPHGQAYH
jgi:predicted ATPase